MGRRRTGSVYESRGVWYASFTIGSKKRSAQMPWAKTKTEAESRTREIQEILDTMGRGATESLAVRFAQEAAKASPDEVREIAVLAKDFAAGKEREIEPAVGIVESIGHEITFGEVAALWTSGELARRYRSVRDIDQDNNTTRLRDFVLDVRHGARLLRDVPIREFTRAHADAVLRQDTISEKSVHHVAQVVSRVLSLAVNPLALIAQSPLPRGWVPRPPEVQKSGFLFPEEVAQLLGCREIPLVRRIFFAFALNEGIRRGRLLALEWSKLVEAPGNPERVMCRVAGKPNKPPVRWVLEDDTARMLRGWRTLCPSKSLVFPAEALPRYRRSRAGKPIAMGKYGEVLRDALKTAGVTRPELFESEDGFRRLVGHDLRAGFIIYSREKGKSDRDIAQHTGHKSKAMIDSYDQAAAILKDSGCGVLPPVDQMIPEITEAIARLDEESSAYRRQEGSPSFEHDEGDS